MIADFLPVRWLRQFSYSLIGLRVAQLQFIDRDGLALHAAGHQLPESLRLEVLNSQRVRILAETNLHVDPVLAGCLALPHHLAVAILDRDRVVGQLWLTRAHVECSAAWEHPLTLPQSLALVQYERIEKAYRHLPLRPQLHLLALQQLHRFGVKYLVSIENPFAGRRQRELAGMGYQSAGTIWRWDVLEQARTHVSRDARRLGIRFHLPALAEEAAGRFLVTRLAEADYSANAR